MEDASFYETEKNGVFPYPTRTIHQEKKYLKEYVMVALGIDHLQKVRKIIIVV